MGVKVNKNGTVTIDYRDKEGKRHRETFAGSKTFGKEVLAKRKTEISEGKFFPERKKARITFGELAKIYWEVHGSKTRSAYTWNIMLNKLINCFGSLEMSQLTTEKVQILYNDIWQEHSSSTANRYLTLLKAVINTAVRLKKYDGNNPCTGVVKQKENNSRWRYLSEQEINRLWKCADKRLQEVLTCALCTGMRRGEILNLRWENVDLTGNIIYILKSKSGNPREIPILPVLRALLTSLDVRSTGRVFSITLQQLRRSFQKALAEAGINNFRFHDLRHTFASHFIMNGGKLPELQKILGHSDFKLTLRYAHLSKSYLQQAITVVSDIIPAIPATQTPLMLETEQHN